MLIKLTRVSCNAAGSKETKIWLNSYHIAKVEPCTIPGDKAKSYVSIKDEYAWRDIKVVETPEMIAYMVNHNRAELEKYDIYQHYKNLSCPLCGNGTLGYEKNKKMMCAKCDVEMTEVSKNENN